MASRNGGSVVERAKVAAEKGRRAAEEAEKNNQLARAKREAEDRAGREAEEKARRVAKERRAAEDRAGREAEEKARRDAEARKREHPNSQDEPLLKKHRTGAPANVSNVLAGIGKVAALEKLHAPLPAPEPPNLGSFFSQSGALFSDLSSNWYKLTIKLLQKQERRENSLLETPQPTATPKAPPKVTVDKQLIYAFINYSNPQDYTEYDQYFKACDFLRRSPQNFEAFKEDLEKDLKNINSIREEGQVKVKAGDILKRAQDVRGLTINSRGEDEYEESKRLKNQDLQNEINIERQKQEERKQKEKKSKENKEARKLRSAPEAPSWGTPPIQLPRKQEVWSKEEIELMRKGFYYARLQAENETAFSKEGLPGEDVINWSGIVSGNSWTTRVYSPDSPPNHMSKLGIGFNQNPLLDPLSTKPPREDTNASYLRLLQTKFDNNNFDISTSVDPIKSKVYIGKRVAEWEGESSQFKIEKTTTNPSNLRDYCEYLMNNIEDLKDKEAEKTGEEIDKSKLKTLIAFQYLELGKIIYAGTWGNTIGELNRSDDSSTQKPEIINKILVTVPDKYKKYLINERNNITHDSISLPRRNPLDSSDIKRYRDYLESLANSKRIKSTFVPRTYEGSNDWDAQHQKMLETWEVFNDPPEYLRKKFDDFPDGGIVRTLVVASAPLGKAVRKASAMGASLLNGAGDFMAWTAQRAGPATIIVPADQKINENTGGYANTNADARAHDENLLARELTKQEYQPDRDNRPESLARRNEASKIERDKRKLGFYSPGNYSKSGKDFSFREGGGDPFAPKGRGGRGGSSR